MDSTLLDMFQGYVLKYQNAQKTVLIWKKTNVIFTIFLLLINVEIKTSKLPIATFLFDELS